MSNFLRDRFPLGDTSTVYMNGKSLYSLVRWDKPGLIATTELYHADAEEFRAAVREAMADAWDEGHEDGQHNEHEHRPGRKITNPYRSKEEINE